MIYYMLSLSFLLKENVWGKGQLKLQYYDNQSDYVYEYVSVEGTID